jgi:hypothetical protein
MSTLGILFAAASSLCNATAMGVSGMRNTAASESGRTSAPVKYQIARHDDKSRTPPMTKPSTFAMAPEPPKL